MVTSTEKRLVCCIGIPIYIYEEKMGKLIRKIRKIQNLCLHYQHYNSKCKRYISKHLMQTLQQQTYWESQLKLFSKIYTNAAIENRQNKNA